MSSSKSKTGPLAQAEEHLTFNQVLFVPHITKDNPSNHIDQHLKHDVIMSSPHALFEREVVNEYEGGYRFVRD